MNSKSDEAVSMDWLVLSEYPFPIAVRYRKMLESPDSKSRVEAGLALFDYGLRLVSLGVVSQYLIRDADKVKDRTLNRLLYEQFPRPSLGTWKKIFFETLRAYGGKRDLLFIPELYDLYWDSSFDPEHPRSDVQIPYERLIRISSDLKNPEHESKNESEWQKLEAEVSTLLKEILKEFAFIQNYNLLRILNRNGDLYDCMLYKGERPTRPAVPIQSEDVLELGSFYLSKRDKQFLPLHPLLIYWEDFVAPQGADVGEGDTGLYDNFTSTVVTYALVESQRLVPEMSQVTEFARLVYYVIQKVKQYRREAQRLTWQLLQKTASEINESRFGAVRDKYNKDLYLQRSEVKQAFDDFLTSNKAMFLLLGKSGVGKSNFLVSLAVEYQDNDDLCFLFYDGAKLETDRPITEVIGRDLESRIRLVSEHGDVEIKDALYEIAQIDGIEDRQVVLIIDAVNENAKSKDLLGAIDALVEKYAFPWLKVVFTSRPEAWRQMKRRIKLAEHRYYRAKDRNDVGVELKGFTLGVEMGRFTRAELPVAYAKYQQVYRLKTAYADISHELRLLLNDPLTLWLVAESNRGNSLPNVIRPGKLYKDYVEKLLADDRLELRDTLFLEETLMPLMIGATHLGKAVSAEQVTDDHVLFNLINNFDLDSNGRHVNQSFTNLVDAEILVQRGTPLDYEIGFKYERFYDYYGGMQLYKLTRAKADLDDFFLELVNTTADKPFLWGAVKSALVQLTENQSPKLVERLCHENEPRMSDMMVEVLIDFGQDYPKRVEELLKTFLPPEPRRSGWMLARRLIRNPITEPDMTAEAVEKIAIEVASQVNNMEWVLKREGVSQSLGIRNTAVRYTYYLWQRQPTLGFQVLEDWSEHVIQGWIPDFDAFESLLGLSLVIFFDQPHDHDALLQLQAVWQSVIGRILRLQSGQGRASRLVRDFVREKLFNLVVTLIFGVLHQMPSYNVITSTGLEAFFQSSPEEKSLFRRLTTYLDVDGTYSEWDMKTDWLATLPSRDMLIGGVTTIGMALHAIRAPLQMLPFLKEFFERARIDPVPSPYLTDIAGAVVPSVLDHDVTMDEIFDFYVYAADICQEYYTLHPNVLGRGIKITSPQAWLMAPYLYAYYRRVGNIHSSWSEGRITAALERKDERFFDFMLSTELPVLGIELRLPQVALDVLELFFDQVRTDWPLKTQVFLSRLRTYFPDEVDDFLQEHEAPDEFSLAVRTHQPNEGIGQAIGTRAWRFFRDDIFLNSPQLRSEFIEILAKMADYRSLQEWADYALRRIINLIYGSEVLRQSH